MYYKKFIKKKKSLIILFLRHFVTIYVKKLLIRAGVDWWIFISSFRTDNSYDHLESYICIWKKPLSTSHDTIGVYVKQDKSSSPSRSHYLAVDYAIDFYQLRISTIFLIKYNMDLVKSIPDLPVRTVFWSHYLLNCMHLFILMYL